MSKEVRSLMEARGKLALRGLVASSNRRAFNGWIDNNNCSGLAMDATHMSRKTHIVKLR